MTTSSTIATIYTTDKKLAFLGSVESKQANAKDKQPIYTVRSSTGHTQQLDASHVVIYDIDLAEGNATQVIEDILHLKLNSQGRPLVLTGSRDSLSAVMTSDKVEAQVTRVITKPWVGSQLNIVVKASVAKHAEVFATANPLKPLYKWLGVGSAATAAVTAAAFFSISLSNAKQESYVAQELSSTLVEQVAYQSNTATSTTDNALASEARISLLINKANKAILKGQAVFPEGNNALNFFDQALEIDAYHAVAFPERQELLNNIRRSFYSHIEQGQLDAADKLANVLRDAEPYSDDNRRVNRVLEQAHRKQRDSIVSDVVTKNPVKPNRKVAQTIPKEVQNFVVEPRASKVVASRIPLKDSKQLASLGNIQPVIEKSQTSEIKDIVVVKRASPKYPRTAVTKKIEGWVEVGFQVDAKGEAVNIHVLKSHPANVFDKSSVRAIEKWKFQAAKNVQTGKTIVSDVNVTKFHFDLKSLKT